jgi:Domain of unknown function (DUF4173)
VIAGAALSDGTENGDIVSVVSRGLDAPGHERAGRRSRYEEWDRCRAGRSLGAALVVGVAVDQVTHTHLVGLAGSLLVVTAALGIVAGLGSNPRRWSWVAASCALAPWLSLRTSPWLIWPTSAAILVLLILAAASDDFELRTFSALARRVMNVIRAGADAPIEARDVVRMLVPPDADRRFARSLPAMAVAAAVGTMLLALLASGDAFFASVLGAASLGSRLVDALVIATGALAWLALVVSGRRAETTHGPGDPGDPQGVPRTRCTPRVAGGWRGPGWVRRRPVGAGTREVASVLVTVAVVLSAYVSSLTAGALGGAAYVERRTGLTYAEYARSGFFQLVAVVAIVGTLLVSCRETVRTSPRRTFLLAVSAVIAVSTLVVVAVSVARLQTYRSAFGLTMLRLSTTVFAAWLGVVVVIVVVALLWSRWDRALVRAVVASAYLTLTIVNVADPEAIVARENLQRLSATADTSAASPVGSGSGRAVDVDYLGIWLSDDAIPALVDRLDRLPFGQQRVLVDLLCSRARTRGDDGWSWNRSRARADRLLAELCTT